MRTRSEIKTNLGTRLETIKASNGYSTDVVTVYGNKIPMGMSLEIHELPAILLVEGPDKLESKGQNRVYAEWLFYLELRHTEVDDETMLTFIGDVAKAIFANHPTADRVDEFRLIHPRITDIDILDIDPDLNMIEANRVAIITLRIRYITKYNEL